MKEIMQRYLNAIKRKISGIAGKIAAKIKAGGMAAKIKVSGIAAKIKEMPVVKRITLKSLNFFLAGLIAGLVITAVALSVYIYQDGKQPVREAMTVTEQKSYVMGKAEITTPVNTPSVDTANNVAENTAEITAGMDTAVQETDQPSWELVLEPDDEDITEDMTDKEESEPDIIGTLVICKTGDELQIASHSGEDSFYYSEGAIPGENGNMVIIGQSYRDGTHFGVFGQLERGDTLDFKTLDGKTYSYNVYRIHKLKQKNEAEFSRNTDELEMTLLIYSGEGNRRLLINLRQNE